MSSKKESSIHKIVHEKDFPGESADDISGSFSDNLSDNLSGNLSDNLADDLSGNLSDNLSGNLSDDLSGNLSDGHPGYISAGSPDDLPETVSGFLNDPGKDISLSDASGKSRNGHEEADVIYQKISLIFKEHGIPGTEEEAVTLLKDYYDDEDVDEFVSSLSGEDPDDRFSLLRTELAETYLEDRNYLSALILLTHINHDDGSGEYDFMTGLASYFFAYDPAYSCPGHTERYLEKAQQAFMKCLNGSPGKEKEKKCRQYLKMIREEIGS